MAVGKPFSKGVSGNPGGRSKAYREQARYGRSLTNDGKEIIDFWLKVMRDDTADMRFRVDCSENLMDRIAGRPVQAIDLNVVDAPVETEAPIDWTKIPIEERERLLLALSTLDGITVTAEPDEAVEH